MGLTQNTLYLVAIEPISTRYTRHWFDYMPKELASAPYDIVTIGEDYETGTTKGAFLDFNQTNIYKNEQLNRIANMFTDKEIKDGDVFLFCDAWNTCAHQVRYMADLNGVNINMIGIWHAGSYDEWDFLGQKVKNKNWSLSLEGALYQCYDYNMFATEFHRDLFTKTVLKHNNMDASRSIISGFPMSYYKDELSHEFYCDWYEKEDIVVFPHRISNEKNIRLFRDIAEEGIPGVEFVVAQEVCNNKEEYHALLRKSKVVFSANMQETLGIGTFEGMLAGCRPFVPNKLSYREMYFSPFRYDAGLIDGETRAGQRRHLLKMQLQSAVHNYDKTCDILGHNVEYVMDNFFTPTELLKLLQRIKHFG